SSSRRSSTDKARIEREPTSHEIRWVRAMDRSPSECGYPCTAPEKNCRTSRHRKRARDSPYPTQSEGARASRCPCRARKTQAFRQGPGSLLLLFPERGMREPSSKMRDPGRLHLKAAGTSGADRRWKPRHSSRSLLRYLTPLTQPCHPSRGFV